MWGRAAALETLAGAEEEAQKETFLALPFVAPSSSALVPNEPTNATDGNDIISLTEPALPSSWGTAPLRPLHKLGNTP